MEQIKKYAFDLVLMSVALLLCVINKKVKNNVIEPHMHLFLCGYFNDLVGAIAYSSICDMIFRSNGRKFRHLLKVIMIMLFCGIVWEYLTPLIRNDTVSDLYDIIAYVSGGIIYYFLSGVFDPANS